MVDNKTLPMLPAQAGQINTLILSFPLISCFVGNSKTHLCLNDRDGRLPEGLLTAEVLFFLSNEGKNQNASSSVQHNSSSKNQVKSLSKAVFI